MCGIFGWTGRPREGLEKAFRVFATTLATGTEKRGPHATGVAAWLGGSRSYVAKGPVKATEFVRTPAWDKALRAKSLIGHCRWATHGDPSKNENNHPFESGKWALIHNGVIGQHREIAKEQGVKLKTECDSEVILRVFAAGARSGAVEGLQRFADSVDGRPADYAVALLDRTNGAVRLLRDDGRPCAIVKLPALGIVAFASTPEILKDAMNAAIKEFPELLDGASGWECAEAKVYLLDPKSREVEHEKIEVKRGGPSAMAEPSGAYSWPQRSSTTTIDPCPMCQNYICACEELTAP